MNCYYHDQRKFGAFISIPKCATKTILDMFELGFNRDNDGDDFFNHYIIYENHQRLSILEKKYDLSNLYVFTFVRNPYDRIKSWFYYHKDMEPYKNTNLNDWIKNGCSTHWTIQNETNWVVENKSPLLQYNFIEGKTNVAFIGKIENFETDCKQIIRTLNNIFEENRVPKRIHYQSLVKNARNTMNKHEDEITPENKELIYNLFRKDFEFFGYEK